MILHVQVAQDLEAISVQLAKPMGYFLVENVHILGPTTIVRMQRCHAVVTLVFHVIDVIRAARHVMGQVAQTV